MLRSRTARGRDHTDCTPARAAWSLKVVHCGAGMATLTSWPVRMAATQGPPTPLYWAWSMSRITSELALLVSSFLAVSDDQGDAGPGHALDAGDGQVHDHVQQARHGLFREQQPGQLRAGYRRSRRRQRRRSSERP